MGKIYVFISAALALFACIVWSQNYDSAEPLSVSKSKAPDFIWNDFEGHIHVLHEISDHPVVIHFWASWCAPCKKEFPSFLHAAFNHPNITFLAISGDESLSDAKTFIVQTRHTLDHPVSANVLFAFDPHKSITTDVFQTVQYPETIYLNASKDMVKKDVGAVAWDDEKIFQEIK